MQALIGDPRIFISELIWTVINFFLLMFLLKRFLFIPVIRFMEKRKAGMDAKIKEEQAAETHFSENQEKLKADKAKSREEAKQLLSQASEEREKLHASAMAAARSDSAKALKDGEEALAQKREQTAAGLEAATPEMAELLAQRLLSEE